ncbi:MAG: hypothetical protein HQK59_13835 [Deltaproteobacteria bacterium]|nr:hypothetical protein [Deltaproteobacteria bacterium]
MKVPGSTALAFGLVWLLLSWPFWAGPEYREPGFLLIYLFIIWIFLVGVLALAARDSVSTRAEENQREDAGTDV